MTDTRARPMPALRRIVAALPLVLLIGCGLGERALRAVDLSPREPLGEELAATGDYTIFLDGLERTGLLAELEGEGPYTVFAPLDVAFRELPDGAVEALFLPERREQLRRILSFHIVQDRLIVGDLRGQTVQVRTLGGDEIELSVLGVPRIDLVPIIERDFEAANGVIHAVDRLLLP